MSISQKLQTEEMIRNRKYYHRRYKGGPLDGKSFTVPINPEDKTLPTILNHSQWERAGRTNIARRQPLDLSGFRKVDVFYRLNGTKAAPVPGMIFEYVYAPNP